MFPLCAAGSTRAKHWCISRLQELLIVSLLPDCCALHGPLKLIMAARMYLGLFCCQHLGCFVLCETAVVLKLTQARTARIHVTCTSINTNVFQYTKSAKYGTLRQA